MKKYKEQKAKGKRQCLALWLNAGLKKQAELPGFRYICKKNNMGTGNIQVSFPEELGFALKMKEPEFANEMRRLAIVKLYELGKLSSGKAAELLGISCVAFLELVGT